MGFRIKASSWRAPLQIIDSFLPQQEARTTACTRPERSSSMRAFFRAGWLRGLSRTGAAHHGCFQPDALSADAVIQAGPPVVRIVRNQTSASSMKRQGARLVISGRISDVCAELDRLAAQESRMSTT